MKLTTPRCKICRRTLTDPLSIAKGVGPECGEKFAWMLCDAGLTLEALNIPFLFTADENVARFLRLAEQALLDRNKRAVELFKNAARRAAERLAAQASALAT
ncbi:MAG: DUF6011 domain-containing protein [Acidobacteria bacterium]|nr:DUF6011 domain-containing protein [Acidobacteriota bacterium]